MTPERITEILDGLKRWRHEDEDGPLVRELLDAVEQAHAAGQREGERKGIERAAKRLSQCEVRWMPDTIHDIPLHRPRELAAMIEEFVLALDR